MSHVMNTYARQPVAFVRGEGVWLWDEAGKKYLDALAGIAVNTLGHNHPRLVRALTRPDAGSVEFAAGTEASTGIPRLGAPISPLPSEPIVPQPGAGAAPDATGEQPAQPQPGAAPAGPLLVPFGGVKPTPQ